MANADNTAPMISGEEATEEIDTSMLMFDECFTYFAFTLRGWAVGDTPEDAFRKLKADGLVSAHEEERDKIGLCRYPKSPENTTYDIEFFLPQVKELEILYSPYHFVPE